MLDRQSIEEAAQEYPGSKYPEVPYLSGLFIVERAQHPDPALIEAVRSLFEWKLARFSTRAPNRKASESAVQEPRLKAGISFRDGAMGFEQFSHIAAQLTSTSIVLPAFYVHIWRPAAYPILDEKVWKVFCRERGLPVAKNTKPRSWVHYEAYRSFFADLVNRTGLDCRTLDRGLWVLGGELKKSLKCRSWPSTRVLGGMPVRQATWERGATKTAILPARLDDACQLLQRSFSPIPFPCRGIKITARLVAAAIEILNSAPNRTLPQNCRQPRKADEPDAPDGLDRRIKERLKTHLRTANIISNVLETAGIVELVKAVNPSSGRIVNGTRLRPEWGW